VAQEHNSSGDEVMHIELFGSQPLPTWMHRPHLSGRFMSIPASVRFSAPEAEVRTFPGVLRNVSSKKDSHCFSRSYCKLILYLMVKFHRYYDFGSFARLVLT
jgi:hypothetical protein